MSTQPENPLEGAIQDMLDPEVGREVIKDTIARAGLLAGMAEPQDGDERRDLFENLLIIYESVAKEKSS